MKLIPAGGAISAMVFSEETQCRKCRHKTPDDAMRHAIKFLNDRGEVLSPYLCPHCSFFHVGHAPKAKKPSKPVISQSKEPARQVPPPVLNVNADIAPRVVLDMIVDHHPDASFLSAFSGGKEKWAVQYLGYRWIIDVEMYGGNVFDARLRRVENKNGETLNRVSVLCEISGTSMKTCKLATEVTNDKAH